MSGRRSESNGRVESVVQALLARFGTAVEAASIAAEVEAEFAVYYSNTRVTDFVPIFVERRLQTRLRSRLRDTRAPRSCRSAAIGARGQHLTAQTAWRL